MTTTARELMSTPVGLPADTVLRDAARTMRDEDVGDVLVTDGQRLRGVVTDRDVVVRAIAEGLDPTTTTLGDVCSADLVTLRPDATVADAAAVMRDHAVRRLPVVDGDEPVGIVSLGDLALAADPGSALAEISAAPANT